MEQAQIIRRLAPNHWITTNGLFGHLDSHELAEQALDFVSFDSYPAFSNIFPDAVSKPFLDRMSGWGLSHTRAISPNFCVMEQQSGPGGWANRIQQPAPKPGQLRLWTYQSVAHGADLLLYFRWRTAVFGTEIYWHGINDHHNQENRRCLETAQVAAELERIGPVIAGTKNAARAAIAQNYDNEWDGELDTWHGPHQYQSDRAWMKAFGRSHIPVDLLYLRSTTTLEDLRAYDLLVVSHLSVCTEAAASLLTEYVRLGGTAVFGCRSGYKDERGHCRMTRIPGPLTQVCGATVDDYTMIGPLEEAAGLVGDIAKPGQSLTAPRFVEILTPSTTAEVLATYETGYYSGRPALVRNSLGAGSSYYFGSVFTEDSATAVLECIGLQSPVRDWIALPEEVDVVIRGRERSTEQFVFLLNYAAQPQAINLLRPALELISGDQLSGALEIPPFGVLVLSGQ